MANVRVGTAGWGIPRADALRFPGEGVHLQRYARMLRCAEINATFYKPPRAKTLERWAASVGDDFRFSVKAPKTITHAGALPGTADLLAGFFEGIAPLGKKLGPVLFQLPPKLEFDEAMAQDFFAALRGVYDGAVVMEPRHATWFTAAVSRMMGFWKVARVAADPARVPEAAVPGGFAGLVYYRLHGSPRTYYTAYSEEYLRGLARGLRGLQAGTEAWVVFDNTASGAAAGNALDLMEYLERK